MAKDSIRGLAQLAAGFGEMSLAQAKEVAKGLTVASGLDSTLKPKKLSAKVTTLAEDILAAVETNRQQILGLVRHEVENALSRADVARLADVEAAKQAVFGLAAQVDELQRALVAAVGGARSDAKASEAPKVESEATAEPVGQVAPSRPPRRAFTAKKVAPAKAVAKKLAPAKAVAKKTPAKKTEAPAKAAATPKKRAAKKSAPAKKTEAPGHKVAPAKRAPAKRAPAKKAAAKQSAPAKKSAPGTKTEAPAKKGAVKQSAAKRTPAKKGAGATK